MQLLTVEELSKAHDEWNRSVVDDALSEECVEFIKAVFRSVTGRSDYALYGAGYETGLLVGLRIAEQRANATIN